MKNAVFWDVAPCGCHISEDGILHRHLRENLKSYVDWDSSPTRSRPLSFRHFSVYYPRIVVQFDSSIIKYIYISNIPAFATESLLVLLFSLCSQHVSAPSGEI
jgi:hypothetical protein